MDRQLESITYETTIGEIKGDPRIKKVKERMGLSVGMKDTMRISGMIQQNPAWAHGDMLLGFQRMLELLKREIPLFYEITSETDSPVLYFFPSDQEEAKERPFVLIAPGGAYVSVACTVEGFPVAAKLNEMGYHAFVLHYRTGIGCLGKAKEDYKKALQYIFSHRQEWGIRTDRYFVMGFSAGGHLTSICATDMFDWNNMKIPCPTGIILGYPLQNFRKGGMIIRVCRICAFGLFASGKKISQNYVPDHISKRCPPVYLWQTRDDESVPYKENGERLYQSLQAMGIKVKMRTVETGLHGMGLGKDSGAEGWLEEAVTFLNS